MAHRMLVTALVAAAVAGAAGAQQDEPQATFEEELDVAEVLLDVIVTDEHGRTVAGLTVDDFMVVEEGVPREILYLTFVEQGRVVDRLDELGPGHSPIDLSLEDTSGERYFILFFHQPPSLRGLFGRLVHAAHQAGWWAQDELRPGDRAAVVAYDNKLELHQDFTGETTSIARAATRAAGRSLPEKRPPAPGSPSLFAHLPASDRQLLDRTSDIRHALQELARAAGEIAGRKHLLFFTLGSGLRRSERGLLSRRFVPTFTEVLNDNDVAVHSIYLGPPDIGPGRYSEVLDVLSRNTGGIYQSPRNLFTGMLRDTSDRIGAYYLLSYRTHYPRGTSGYREIVVRTRDPELQVYSRQGYLYGDP